MRVCRCHIFCKGGGGWLGGATQEKRLPSRDICSTSFCTGLWWIVVNWNIRNDSFVSHELWRMSYHTERKVNISTCSNAMH